MSTCWRKSACSRFHKYAVLPLTETEHNQQRNNKKMSLRIRRIPLYDSNTVDRSMYPPKLRRDSRYFASCTNLEKVEIDLNQKVFDAITQKGRSPAIAKKSKTSKFMKFSKIFLKKFEKESKSTPKRRKRPSEFTSKTPIVRTREQVINSGLIIWEEESGPVFA